VPDPKDNKYLELAVAGGADVIVSRDVRHLLSMHPGAAFRSCLVSMAARFRSDHASTEYGIDPGSGVAGVSFLNITASGFPRADQSRERYHSVGADPAAIPSRHCRK